MVRDLLHESDVAQYSIFDDSCTVDAGVQTLTSLENSAVLEPSVGSLQYMAGVLNTQLDTIGLALAVRMDSLMLRAKSCSGQPIGRSMHPHIQTC